MSLVVLSNIDPKKEVQKLDEEIRLLSRELECMMAGINLWARQTVISSTPFVKDYTKLVPLNQKLIKLINRRKMLVNHFDQEFSIYG
jgi:hypothetical protein